MNKNMTISEQLFTFLNGTGLDHTKIAKATGIPLTTLYRFRTEGGNLSTKTMNILAKYFGLSLQMDSKPGPQTEEDKAEKELYDKSYKMFLEGADYSTKEYDIRTGKQKKGSSNGKRPKR